MVLKKNVKIFFLLKISRLFQKIFFPSKHVLDVQVFGSLKSCVLLRYHPHPPCIILWIYLVGSSTLAISEEEEGKKKPYCFT